MALDFSFINGNDNGTIANCNMQFISSDSLTSEMYKRIELYKDLKKFQPTNDQINEKCDEKCDDEINNINIKQVKKYIENLSIEKNVKKISELEIEIENLNKQINKNNDKLDKLLDNIKDIYCNEEDQQRLPVPISTRSPKGDIVDGRANMYVNIENAFERALDIKKIHVEQEIRRKPDHEINRILEKASEEMKKLYNDLKEKMTKSNLEFEKEITMKKKEYDDIKSIIKDAMYVLSYKEISLTVCNICREDNENPLVFECGHMCCNKCFDNMKLKKCYLCDININKTIKLYI